MQTPAEMIEQSITRHGLPALEAMLVRQCGDDPAKAEALAAEIERRHLLQDEDDPAVRTVRVLEGLGFQTRATGDAHVLEAKRPPVDKSQVPPL